ncbi:MAG TPA: HigA family addiction module antitoxin [Thermoanaerobaculia bacterium]|nr:HigA family addiction module antitoxin [Thermoanaerobaculia bacterium]
MSTKLLDPIHPGEILAEEFMRPLGLSANALARTLAVPVTRISEIVRGRRGVSADSALRLARFFGTSAELWMGLQAEYDLRVARRMAGTEILRLVPAPARKALRRPKAASSAAAHRQGELRGAGDP